jgi:hypothetical protein
VSGNSGCVSSSTSMHSFTHLASLVVITQVVIVVVILVCVSTHRLSHHCLATLRPIRGIGRVACPNGEQAVYFGGNDMINRFGHLNCHGPEPKRFSPRK